MTLPELFESKGYNYYPTDKNTLHSYLEIYQSEFLKFKDEDIKIIEIGASAGGGLKLFEEWFTKAELVGYELYISPNQVPLSRANVINKSALDISSTEFLDNPPTIVIDDASHKLEDQLYIIKTVYPQIKDGGLLIVEDILDLDNSKSKFDELNIPYDIVDLRNKKGRFDDVLLIFRK